MSNIKGNMEQYNHPEHDDIIQQHANAIITNFIDGKKILHIGEDLGRTSYTLSHYCSNIISIDTNKQCAKESNKKYRKDNLKFIYGDIENFSFEDEKFDSVIYLEKLEYIEDLESFFEEIRRVLKKDGIFICHLQGKNLSNEKKFDSVKLPELLHRKFDHIHLTGLRMGLVSLGFQAQNDTQTNLPSALTYTSERDQSGHMLPMPGELRMERPDFILAACSMAPLPKDFGSASLFVPGDQDLWAEELEQRSQAMDDRDTKDHDLRRELDATRAQLDAVRQDLKAALEDVDALHSRQAGQGQDGPDAKTISRLLSRITGQSVEDGAQSFIEQLFVINQTMVEQRGQLDGALALAAKAAEFEQQANALREELAQNRSKLTDARVRLDREQNENEKISARLNDVNLLLLEDQAKLSSMLREEAILRGQLSDVTDRLSAEQKEASDARTRIADLNRQYQDAQKEEAILRGQLSDITKRLAAEREEAGDIRGQIVDLNRQLRDSREALEDAKSQRAKLERALKSSAPSMSAVADGTTENSGSRSGNADFAQSGSKSTDRQAANARREMERFVRTHTQVRQQIADKAHGVHDRLLPPQRRVVPKGSAIKQLRRKFDRDAAPFKTILFDSAWLATQSPDAAGVRLGRYLRDPGLWSLDPHPLFSSSYYLSRNPDVAREGLCPLRHYLDHGWREGRDPHPYFMNDWYLGQNPDVLAVLTVTPLEHYLEFGWRENRFPNPLFSPKAYLERYPDVVEADMDPLTHYIVYGRREERELPLQAVNPAWASMLSGDRRGADLLEFMLSETPLPMPERPAIGGVAETTSAWPPERLNDFWIPQKLRDFMVQGGHEGEIDLFTYLCSVMEAFRDRPDAFPQSQPCRQIHDRVSALSASRAAALPHEYDATIIIPVYNNVIDTLLCIASVLEDATSKTFEIVVADDGSTDATPQIIATLGGVVRYLRQPRNYGFLGNCNAAAKEARGRHIVLLNNDTLVLPRWLDGLLDLFDEYEKVGLTGSKLISWDGSLQEAGGIYWKDGSAWNFGRGANAASPEFNYVKDVDYVSGAAIAIPSSIWRAMDGFDEIYAPAYCEDSDIAFRLREAGYRTLLNPASEVLHHEGRSHGRDLNSGIKAYQVKNQQTFLERWRPVLERDHYPNAQNVLRARDRSFYKKHVLVIDHYVPQWDQDAGSRSTFMCIKAMLKLGYAVTFWPENLWRDPQYTPMLQEMGVEVIYGNEYHKGFSAFIEARADLYDAVFAQRPHIAPQFIDDIRSNTSATILYYGHDLHYKRMMAAQAVGKPVTDAEIADMRRQELDVCAKADVIFYPDQAEVDLVAQELGGDRVYQMLPVYAFEQEKFAQSSKTLSTITGKTGFNLLFVGGFSHTPNQDGVLWFVKDVLPIIRRKLGEVHLTIVGSKATPAILSLASKNIDVTGFVTDERLAELYDETSLVIAPLRYGGGVKGKVIEAMANGIPMVTTPIGAQGLNKPENMMFLASAADEFAEAVILALTDRTEAALRAKRAWEYTRTHFSMKALEDIFSKNLKQ